MLRDLIAWVLNNYLGKYVGNLNTAQLTIALLSGEVELENLPLRRDALRSLGLPLQALSGTIGKIKLQVPIRQLRSAPWCISIERVYVVVGPYNLDEWDAEAEEQADVDHKVSRLDRLEAKWRAAREAPLEGGYYASSYSGWMSYGTSIVTHVVENMQLKINDVHIRYEDSISIPNHRFACGITIDSLSAQTCDSNWQPGLAAGFTSSASFKLVELQSLNVYWDPLSNSEVFGETSSSGLVTAMHDTKWQHRYVISPVTAEARLKRDRSENPLRTRNRPRLVCDLVVNEMSLTLNDWQYNQMVASVRGLDDIAKYRRFRLLRPQQTVRAAPKSWWLYGCQCHGLLKNARRKLQPSYIRDNVGYMKLYLKIVRNPNETLSADEKLHKDEVERQRDYEELKTLREICMDLVPVTNPGEVAAPSEKGRGMLLQWFPQWWGWYKADPGGTEIPESFSDNKSEASGSTEEDTNKLEDDILNALSVSVDNNSVLKRDAVFGKFDFTLKRGTMDICSGDPATTEVTPMLQLQFENLFLSVETRPRSGSHFVGLSLGTVYLKDRITLNSEFPDLVRPQQKENVINATMRQKAQKRLSNSVFSVMSHSSSSTPVSPPPNVNPANAEPLFVLQYERKPLLHNTDYRLFVKTQSLDIVYNTGAIKWLVDFAASPHQVLSARRKIEAMKKRTKKELIKNWENILEGDLSERKSWTFEIDISAPQIIFVENFSNKNGLVMLIDFGRLQLSNGLCGNAVASNNASAKFVDEVGAHSERELVEPQQGDDDDDDDDTFLTPCSTPPGSNTDSPTLCSAIGDMPEIINKVDSMPLNETSLHNKIYDKYSIDLTDLQVLVCKGKDGLLAASSKGSSPLHVLDRFNISLQMERRIVMTTDPQYPSLKLSGTLPKLVVHMNEMKIAAITTMWGIFNANDTTISMSNRSPASENVSQVPLADVDTLAVHAIAGEEDADVDPQRELSKLVILQFAIDQMVLEVQSQGRGIAELQVTGVKAGFSKRPTESSISLSVHGLLLADAIQSFGPDFELLIASHRHVGIDSVSGSLKQSEPCSPMSPGSPDPMQEHLRRPTSPHTISKALHCLQKDNSSVWDTGTDLDALITVEVLFVTPLDENEETVQIANIQFNNLDIIANQETIVELIGFSKRVFPNWGESRSTPSPWTPHATGKAPHAAEVDKPIRTEITFDFHRLNVLVLRAVVRDAFMVGRKVGTFTMSEARIHATVGSTITVEGSLGGLQVLDLTPEGINHQRILSVGKDPLTEPPNLLISKEELMSSLAQEIYSMGRISKTVDSSSTEERQALSFVVSRNEHSIVDVRIRMASVWYTHCARFVQELTWCASEFAHYLKNLAKSIREKATDMALGLVQPRPDATPRSHQIAYSPARTPFFKSTPAKGTVYVTEDESQKVIVRVDVVLDTPVLVLPRSSSSTQVYVAHLGKISVSNYSRETRAGEGPPHRNESTIFTISEEDTEVNEILGASDKDDLDMFQIEDINFDYGSATSDSNGPVDSVSARNNAQTYDIDVRNMNLFTLDTCKRKGFRLSALPRAEEFYSCKEEAVAVLHDTAIRLQIVRSMDNSMANMAERAADAIETLQVTGSVLDPLHLSLSKQQYEQLLDTIGNIFKVPPNLARPPNQASSSSAVPRSEENVDVDGDVQKEKIKLRLFEQPSLQSGKSELEPRVTFSLPLLKIELKNEMNVSLIDMAFRDFNFDYQKSNPFETSIQVSLKSILMEDLMQPIDSKNRIMVTSQALADSQSLRASSAFGSVSCPNLVGLYNDSGDVSGSLPENLESRAGFYPIASTANQKSAKKSLETKPLYPETPPPSPQQRANNQEHLVVYSALIVDDECPTFETQYKSMRQSSSIDFNSLDLNISVTSLFNLLDFFGLSGGDDDDINEPIHMESRKEEGTLDKVGNTELDISIRSLSVILVKPAYEIAKANISNAHFVVSKRGVTKMVDGRLGSMSLLDLSDHGRTYRERFMSSGSEALNFRYAREKAKSNLRTLQKDAELKIQMSSVRYVHTKRFVMDIQMFFKDFLQLQSIVMRKIQPTDSRLNLSQRPTQLGLEIIADSPIIVLPMSADSHQVIVADLGQFKLTNTFRFSLDTGIISIPKLETGEQEILDVMTVNLVNTDLFTGTRYSGGEGGELPDGGMYMGSFMVAKDGPSVLQGKLQLNLQVERNMDSWQSHNVPDISVQGTLSSVEAILDLKQYKLVRGLLAFNLGECIADLYLEPTFNLTDSHVNLAAAVPPTQQQHSVWTNMAITLDLQNVAVQLKTCAAGESSFQNLARINFIKSSLKIESFTDNSQDIDLVSQEILISDIRNLDECSEAGTKNVFEHILKPIDSKCNVEDFVQAEIYSRKKNDCSKYTILLNNMRLFAILDWLESARDFLFQAPDEPVAIRPRSAAMAAKAMTQAPQSISPDNSSFELVLNITDSELVFVENTEQLDTNAVILRSTTILSYRPNEVKKAMSINLNHLEVFSCILGSEEATALSIIDPMTVNLDIREEILDIHFHKRLCIRLSYNDLKMFQKMAESLPKQTKSARSVGVLSRQNSAVIKLVALGFMRSDCERAMVLCENRLDDAALWLTHNAPPMAISFRKRDPLEFRSVELRASLISICVIDDCKDADVPLLEFSLAELEMRQEMGRDRSFAPDSNGFKAGHLRGTFFSAYYNRFLSGWEPLIEPWKCEAQWTYSLGQMGTEQNRLVLDISSSAQLNVNLTSTVIELYQQVRDNWIEDFYERDNRSGQLHRRRTPFVPFALRNETGLRLHFTTLVSTVGVASKGTSLSQACHDWLTVEPGTTVPFSFGAPHKLRHFDSHKLNLHQIGVRIEGWREVGPISVDRVGVYFRNARMDVTGKALKARVVFAVTMEGSAQKLIIVRSSLSVLNKLDTSVQIKLDHLYTPLVNDWPESITAIVKSSDTYSVPISHVHAFLHMRPTTLDYKYDDSTTYSHRSVPIGNTSEYWNKFDAEGLSRGVDTIYQYSDKPIHWKEMSDVVDVQQEYRTCKSNRDVHYRMVVAMRREKYPAKDVGQIPGHTLVLYPPLRIHNLLPCDLMYRLQTGVGGSVAMSKTANVYEVDLEAQIELQVTLEGYPGAGLIVIPPGLTGTAELKFNLFDTQGRPLNLRSTITVLKGCGLQVSVSASYWLVNRTGLPLIFKQEAVNYESSGQFGEHEEARLLSPLMFSFSDPDAQQALTIRLGKRYGSNPPFCTPINLQKDLQNRQLKAASSSDVFIIGIDIRRGRGRYAKTSVVTFSPRFQIYNRSSYKLQFAQKCFATAASDPLAKSTFIDAVPDCHIPFHWPRLDKDQDLCVRLPDEPYCLWSGGIKISESASCYVNIRNRNGDMHFLRLEIVLQGATYFLLFGNAQVLPPPIRIDNFSEVPIRFHQPNGRYTERTTVKPNSSMAYVLDEPAGPKCLQIEPPGGTSYNFQLNELNNYDSLSYENFTYIAFTGTFKNTTDISKTHWDFNVENSQLVLEVVGDRVMLMKKQPGNRNQLWRLNRDNQLEHEGSSPPTEPGVKRGKVQRFVLDLEHPPQPMQYVSLKVREINPQRRYTQTWTFTEEGRLMCHHANMCVQAANGVFGLRHGSEVVYGMIVSDKQTSNQLVPIEQAIETQKQRPGSGVLAVKVTMDGPIKNLQIYDVKKMHSHQPITLDTSWAHVSYNLTAQSPRRQTEGAKSINEFHITLKLQRGLGLSLVSRQPCEELMFVTLENISLEYISTAAVRNINLNVGDLQIDNQLLESPCSVMLYTNKAQSGDLPDHGAVPAIALSANMLPSPNKNAVIFQYFVAQLRPMSMYLEERLMLRMVDFLGVASVQQDATQLSDESDFEAQRVASKLMAANSKRYYFGKLEVVFSQNRVSVITASKLSPRMAEVKKAIGLTLIKFEDAVIDFEKFSVFHQFETLEVYMRAIKSHYKRELKWQATSILGSVDFLGNPFGFASDVTEGVSGLIFEGSVKSLVKNVTHGISNSTAKLTETISDGLGRVVLDEEDTETRQRILEVGNSNNSTNHLVAGLKGFGFGLLGGVTSIVKHTYTGAQNDGIPGMISGFGMGLVGTVTKPVIGVLDLASETANAVREKSRSSHRILPERKRNPRCVSGAPGNLLPPFSNTQSKGQLILYSINKRDFGEQLVEYEPCLYKKSLLRLLVSTENVLVFTRDEDVTKITLSCHLSELISCHALSLDEKDSQLQPRAAGSKQKSKGRKHYIQLCLNVSSKSMTTSTQLATQGPLVRCQSEEMAQKLSRIINYAKGMYDERELTLSYSEVSEDVF